MTHATDAAAAPEPAPPGAQPERTALSWQRSLLGTGLGSVLLTMTAVRAGLPVLAVGGGLVVVAIAVLLVLRSPTLELRSAPGDVAEHARGARGTVWPDLVRLATAVATLGLLGLVMALVRAAGA